MQQIKKLTENKLQKIINLYLPDVDCLRKLTVSFLRKTNNSILYKACSPALPYPLLIKQIRTSDSAAQYHALTSAYEKMNDGVYCVPTPINYIAEENIIIMEYVNAVSLDKILLKSDLILDKKQYIEKSAFWLSRFHSMYHAGTGVVDTSKKIVDLSQSLSKLKSKFNNNSQLMAVWNWLEDTASHVQTCDTSIGYTHGDFKQENILFSEEKVYGLDFLLEEKGPQIMDLVQYTNHFFFLTLTLKGNLIHKHLNDWIKYFLDAYSQKYSKVNIKVFSWLQLHHLLRYWSLEAIRNNPVAVWRANKLQRIIYSTFQLIH